MKWISYFSCTFASNSACNTSQSLCENSHKNMKTLVFVAYCKYNIKYYLPQSSKEKKNSRHPRLNSDSIFFTEEIVHKTIYMLTIHCLVIDFCAETAKSIWQGWMERSGETEGEQACVQTGPHHQGEVRVYVVLSLDRRGCTSTLCPDNNNMLWMTFLCVKTVLCDRHLFVSKQYYEYRQCLSRCLQTDQLWESKNSQEYQEYDTLIILARPTVSSSVQSTLFTTVTLAGFGFGIWIWNMRVFSQLFKSLGW